MRYVTLPALILTVLLCCLASPAQAKGLPVRGQEILTAKPVKGLTGNCSCQTQWFTMGVKAGTLKVHAVLHGYDISGPGAYGIRLRLYRGTRFVAGAQAACLNTQRKRCNRPANITVHVPTGNVYYLEVMGPGAGDIHYTVSVHANLRLVDCRHGGCH